MAVGTPKNNAEKLAENIVEADYRGFYGHGLNRLGIFVGEVQHSVCNVVGFPKVLKETPATAWIDGNNGFGSVVGSFCMDLAIEKAQKVGIGLVVCKGSNHFGIGTMYTAQALKKNLIGICFTNTSPLVAPPRTRSTVIGTNSISMAAPGLNADSFNLDMATSAVSRGTIEMQQKKHLIIPSAWADSGSGALCPLGGTETNSSYKGYGLAVLVEVLCGILSGGAYGSNIRMLGSFDKLADLGHCFIAIDPKGFATGFEGRLSDLMETLRRTQPIDPKNPVLIAGDREKLHMKSVDQAGGVTYTRDQLEASAKIAKNLRVKPLQPK
ncbi:hypothetical protein MTP99_001891 [Tenebrio molitor]|nr:hypothetical protein MTP99_001891 [Tenebrio molitor]